MKPSSSLNDSVMHGNCRIRAAWLITGVCEPIRGGCVVVRNGRITAVENKNLGPVDVELEDSVLMPGLINSHTHLEFSGLSKPLSGEGGFAAWVRKVIAYRQERWGDMSSDSQLEIRRLDLQSGLEEAVQSGTVAVADIATNPYPIQKVLETASSQPLLLWGLGEVLGWTEQRQHDMRSAFERMQRQCASREVIKSNDVIDCSGSGGRIDYRCGISPHAPYSTSPRVIQWAIERSRVEKRLLAMHLGETLEEMEWLAARSGVFAELLERMGVGEIPLLPQWLTARDYLLHLSRAWRTLVVHGNYLSEMDWEILASHRQTMSVVYCPRTHRHFGHTAYPLAKMQKAGVRVILGTDSRASNPDLSIWGELQSVAAGVNGIRGDTVLQLATTEAAEGLGIGKELGAIEAGKIATFAVAKILDSAWGEVSSKFLWERLWDSRDVAMPQRFGL